MTLLILGLIVFLGVHSTRIFADDWRSGVRQRLGDNAWKGIVAVLSLAGFVAIAIGYGQTRADVQMLWLPPIWTRHLAALLTIPAFILVVAAYVPGNAIKAKLHHPMVLGVKVWALSHLIANGMLADLLLFGGFLAWSVASYAAARKRDRVAGTVYAAGRAVPTAIAVVVGLAAWAFFAFWAHGAWIGVKPFGGGG